MESIIEWISVDRVTSFVKLLNYTLTGSNINRLQLWDLQYYKCLLYIIRYIFDIFCTCIHSVHMYNCKFNKTTSIIIIFRVIFEYAVAINRWIIING